MKFTLETTQGILIHAYQPGEVTLKLPSGDPTKPHSTKTYSSSLVLGQGDTPEDWPVSQIEELALNHFDSVWCEKPDIVLLGTGERLVFPDKEIRQRFGLEGIGFEVMDTAAACRTYNVLVSEGRSIMSFLILG